MAGVEGLVGLLRDTSRPRKTGSAERKEDVTSDSVNISGVGAILSPQEQGPEDH